MNPNTIGYVWTGKFLYPERKSCGFKNIRIRVDGASVSHLEYKHCRACRILWPFMLAVLLTIFGIDLEGKFTTVWVFLLSYQKRWIENHQSQPTSMTLWTAREAHRSAPLLIGSFFFSDALSSLVWSNLLDSISLSRKYVTKHIIHINSLHINKRKYKKNNFSIWKRQNWRFVVEEKPSSLFRIKSWLIHAAVWQLSSAVSSRFWLVAKQ